MISALEALGGHHDREFLNNDASEAGNGRRVEEKEGKCREILLRGTKVKYKCMALWGDV